MDSAGFRMIAIIIYQGLGLCYPSQPSASADNSNFGLDNYRYHAQLHPIIVNWCFQYQLMAGLMAQYLSYWLQRVCK